MRLGDGVFQVYKVRLRPVLFIKNRHILAVAARYSDITIVVIYLALLLPLSHLDDALYHIFTYVLLVVFLLGNLNPWTRTKGTATNVNEIDLKRWAAQDKLHIVAPAHPAYGQSSTLDQFFAEAVRIDAVTVKNRT